VAELKDLIRYFRQDVFDPELPGSGDSSESLWTNDEITRYADQAQEEFARVTHCLSDSRTFRPTIILGDGLVKADPRIIKVKTAYLESSGKELDIVRSREMDEGATIKDYGLGNSRNSWREGFGVPTHLVTDDEYGYFRLYPALPASTEVPPPDPLPTDTLVLAVYRLPKEPLLEGGELEIPAEWHMKMLDGMKAQAYLKEDIEVNDDQKAMKFRARWEHWLSEGKKSFRVFYRGSRSVEYGGI